MRANTCLLLSVLLLIAGSLSAETLAVSVRLEGEADEENQIVQLLSQIEEGAMDAMFEDGHIVFDIELNEELQLSRFDAIDGARIGGARYLLLIDAGFGEKSGVGIVPLTAGFTIVDVRSEADRHVNSVDPASLPGVLNKSPETISREVGQLAAMNALSVIREEAW